MSFYAEPAFFILLVPIVAIAMILGMRGKPLGRYGLAVSVIMVLLLFSRTPASLAFFICYLVYSIALERFVLGLFRNENPRRIALYRCALALQIAPLAVYKVGVLFEPDFLGFIGISYITFKAVQVLIETRDGLIKSMGVDIAKKELQEYIAKNVNVGDVANAVLKSGAAGDVASTVLKSGMAGELLKGVLGGKK